MTRSWKSPIGAPRRPHASAAARALRPATLALAVLLAGCATLPGANGPVRSPMPDRREPARTTAAPAGTSSTAASAPAATRPDAGPVAGTDDVPVPAPTPVPESVVGSTASGGRITTRTAAVVDSGPSPAAMEVLATIPDPVPAGERVPPPERVRREWPAIDATPGRGMAGADSANGATAAPAADTTAADTSSVPTPEPTAPLGQRRQGTVPVIPDSVMRAIAEAARIDSIRRATGELPPHVPAAPATPAPAAGATPAASDTCWRVQVAAPEESERAEQMRGAAESLLLVPMVVETEGGLHKVRTRDCMNGDAAARLRARAAPLFEGAFRFVRPR